MLTSLLLSVFALVDLAVGLYLVRYSGGAERRRPEAVLLVGVLLVLAAGFLLAVVVRLHAWPVVVHERAPAGVTAVSRLDDGSVQVDVGHGVELDAVAGNAGLAVEGVEHG